LTTVIVLAEKPRKTEEQQCQVQRGISDADRNVRCGDQSSAACMQVSVAILLDNFVSASARIKGEREDELVEERRRLLDGLYPLRPLLSHLTRVRKALPWVWGVGGAEERAGRDGDLYFP
jgi:hypothetical protein